MSIKKLVTIVLSLLAICLIGCVSFAKGWQEANGEWFFVGNDGEIVTETIKASDGLKFYLDENGLMARDYLLENYNEAIYYFNDEGAMVSNTWVAVDPSQVANPIEDGPTVYLYYFGSNGKAYKASDGLVKKTIDGKKYLFDEEGRMLSGWINSSGEMFTAQDMNEDPFQEDFIYFAGDETDGELREGWYEFTDGSLSDDYYKRESIWFYFNPSNNKKVRYDGSNNRGTGDKEFTTKKINGKTYAFDVNGVMLIGWEAEPSTRYFAENKMIEGQLVKKDWIFTIPPEGLEDNTDYEDEVERWFYASKSGNITKSVIKKINGKDYVFDDNGIMKSGLVIVDRATRNYVAVINVESTDGREFLVDRKYTNKDNEKVEIFNKESQMLYYFREEENESDFGSRKLGDVKLAFSDKDYSFHSEKNGEREGLKNKEKKYYQHGLRLLPDPMIGYGLVLESYASPSILEPISLAVTDPDYEHELCSAQRVFSEFRDAKFESEDSIIRDIVSENDYNEYYVNYNDIKYGSDVAAHWLPYLKVVGSDGKKVNKSNTAKKDKNGNYWIIGEEGRFIKVVSVPVKYSKSRGWEYRSEAAHAGGSVKSKTQYIPFGVTDTYGRTVKMAKQDDGYDVDIDEQYALNFNLLFD